MSINHSAKFEAQSFIKSQAIGRVELSEAGAGAANPQPCLYQYRVGIRNDTWEQGLFRQQYTKSSEQVEPWRKILDQLIVVQIGS